MSKCPICGCRNFFVKDPDDEYETHVFSVSDGTVAFSQADGGTPPVDGQTRIRCDDCTWSGCLDDIAEK